MIEQGTLVVAMINGVCQCEGATRFQMAPAWMDVELASRETLSGVSNALADHVSSDESGDPLSHVRTEADFVSEGEEETTNDGGPEFTRFEFIDHLSFLG